MALQININRLMDTYQFLRALLCGFLCDLASALWCIMLFLPDSESSILKKTRYRPDKIV